jgi:lantibiotic biosynthesis protein
MHARAWRALFTGAEAEPLRARIEAIASSLSGFDPELGPGLSSGAAGRALLFHHLAAGHADAAPRAALAERWMERAAELLAHTRTSAGLFEGFAGVGFAATVLGWQEGDALAAIDDGVSLAVERDDQHQLCDVITGPLGLGVYLLRRPAAVGGPALDRILEQIATRAQIDAEGARWFSTSESFHSEGRRRSYPQGCYDLGLAHGLAGIVTFLSRVLGRGRGAATRLAPLIEAAITWLWRKQLPRPRDDGQDWPSRFGGFVLPDGRPEPRPSRASWCYGDVGIGVSLWRAGEACQRPEWQADGLALVKAAARLSEQRAGVSDACLCHGSAGLGHLCNRLFQESGDPELQQLARHWLKVAVRQAQHPEAAGGYRFPGGSERPGWHEDLTVINGVAGVGLALQSAISEEEPTWDAMLLAA